MSKAVGFAVAGVVVLLFFLYLAVLRSEMDLTPKFFVGQCLITHDENMEVWEVPIVAQIVEIGERSYRYHFWLGDHWSASTTSLSFSIMHRLYMGLPCPELEAAP